MPSSSTLEQLLDERTMQAAPELVRYEEEKSLRCLSCGHRCLIREGRRGICKVRINRRGKLMVPSGYVGAIQVDPIEKKPFNHAFPGRDALSYGMLGCDFHCAYCQNWVTSQALRDTDAVAPLRPVTPESLTALAVKEHCPVMVSTYNEPLITADWSAKVFERARQEGIACGFVSNGNATPEVLDFLRPYLSLYKVDLKSFDDAHYRKLGGVLATVLSTIERLKGLGIWLEVVTLVVPDFNDTEAELRKMAQFLAGVSVDIPWHVTAFHPDYKMQDRGWTPAEILKKGHAIGKEAGLRFVYAGNLPGIEGGLENTWCPCCNTLLIERHGFYVKQNRLVGGSCPDCGQALPGVWEPVSPVASTGTGRPRVV